MMRSPFFDAIFTGITHLGDELAFIVVAVAFYWAVDKRFGFKMINVYLIGCSVLEGVKNLVVRPRPYTYDGVVSVTDPTGGYSFPSGHSHSVANLSTQVSMRYRRSYVIAPLAADLFARRVQPALPRTAFFKRRHRRTCARRGNRVRNRRAV